MIDRPFKFSDVDKIFGNLPMNITTNTTNFAAHEMIHRDTQILSTLALAQVKGKLYNQIIKEEY